MGFEKSRTEGDMNTVDIVVPCYNEEAVLNMFYDESSKIFDSLSNYQFRYIFVNDGSKDKTLDVLRSLAQKDRRVKYISFSRNFGKESAMYAGLVNTTADLVVVMDADLEHPPKLIPEMIEKIEEGYDSVAAMRNKRRRGIKSFFSSLFYKLSNRFTDVEMKQNTQDYRMMTRQMVDAILEMTETQRFTKGIFAWVGFETAWIEHEGAERPAGESKWGFGSLFKYAIRGITNFSISPLRFLTVSGLFISFLAFVAIIVALVRRFAFGITGTDGFTIILIAILFLGGIVEMSLGVLGEYIANIYLETKDRPIYITKESNIEDVK